MTVLLVISIALLLFTSISGVYCFKQSENKKQTEIGGLAYAYCGVICMYGAGTAIAMIIISISEILGG